MSFLGNLSPSTKNRVYVSVTPEVGLEVIQLDVAGQTVENYAVRDLDYNEANRDIADYEEFKSALAEMFEELNIDPKCEVVLNMPLVAFGTMQFPLLLTDASIMGGLQSEVEQSYIFRKSEPVITWQDIPNAGAGASAGADSQSGETRQIIYTAIQSSVITEISEALESIGAVLVGVENSLTSTLRALDFAGYTQSQMQPNVSWNLMLISSTGYSIVSLSGKKIVDYYEEPLPIKSYDGDELYDAINQSAQIALMSCPANYLFIQSDTDQVSASLLASKLQTQSSVTVLENNSFKKQESIVPVGLNVLQSYASKVSLQAVGVGLADVSDYPINLRFSTGATGSVSGEPTCTIQLGDQEITLTPSAAMKIVGVFGGVIVLILALLAFVILPKMTEANQAKLDQVNNDMSTLDSQISGYKSEGNQTAAFNVQSEIENGIKANRSKLMNYVAVGDAIPKSVWLTYFMTQGDGLVDIKGGATNVEDVYVFFKNVRDSLIGTKLRLQKLEMESKSVDEALSSSGSSNYTFEITNMSDDQLTALFAPAAGAEGANGANGASPANGDAQAQQQPANGSTPPQSGLLGTQPIQGN